MTNNTTPSFENYDDAIDWTFIDAKHKQNFDVIIKRSGVPNWRMPFECTINADDFEDYSDAAEYFTGARLEIVEGQLNDEILASDNLLYVRCRGFYEAIGA